jgi:hypothetical protein
MWIETTVSDTGAHLPCSRSTASVELLAYAPQSRVETTHRHSARDHYPVEKRLPPDRGDLVHPAQLDAVRAVARERLDEFLHRLKAMGVHASGEVGSRDPIEAVQDALRSHPVDEVILSTLPSGISRWLGQDVPTRLRGSVTVPVTVVTAAREVVKSS